ncbi:MAG: GWxTD domain-containing protein [Chloroherpetonaceae bacterium]|nr:GWxTD domain-containing protein [Chloroherpetonaceae bacterium]
MRRNPLRILLLAWLVGATSHAQERYMDVVQKHRRPQFYAEFVALPASRFDSVRLAGQVKLSYDNSFFVKTPDGKFSTDLTFSVEALQKNVAVARKIERKTVVVGSHEETTNRNEFVEATFFLPLKKGDYELAVEVTNNDLQKSLRMERLTLQLSKEIVASKAGNVKLSQPFFVTRPKFFGDSLRLQPLGASGNGAFGRDFIAAIYAHLEDDSLKEASYQLFEKRDNREIFVSSRTLSPKELLYVSELRETSDRAAFAAKRQNAPSARLLALADFNAKAIGNARYVLKVNFLTQKGENLETKKEFDNAWIDMPYPLYDIELATRLMEGIMLASEEAKEILDGNPNEQRRKFLAFWKTHDPTPDTEFNEALEEYFRRVDYAFFNFYTNREYGWRTDRGKVYIRFGKPTEITREFPSNRPTREIWIYKNLNKRFVFSDLSNTGNYELISESTLEPEELSNPN